MTRPVSLRPMRLAMIAPPWFTVPPVGYGGVENMCADLVDGLVAPGPRGLADRRGPARTRPTASSPPTPSRPSARLGEPLPEVLHTAAAARVLERLDVDLVHDHTLAGPLLARGRAAPDGRHHARAGAGEPASTTGTRPAGSTSSPSRRPAGRRPDLAWVGTVHNAVDVGSFPFRAEKDEMLLFLGRLHPDKGAHLAIDAARAVGLPIVVAGKCSEPVEQEYFRTHVEPRLGPDVTIFGPVDAAAKRDLLSGAAALVFPILWDEPFGMVMIEAMACGTPWWRSGAGRCPRWSSTASPA